MTATFVLAADIGGGHIAAALVDAQHGTLQQETRVSAVIDSKASAEAILDGWSSCLAAVLSNTSSDDLLGAGFAMPGPFDYRSGVARFEGSDKYESLNGLDVADALSPRLGIDVEMRFVNDATAFGIGEAQALSQRDTSIQRILAITLGTGFGSAFLERGVPITSGPSVPLHGNIWHLPFRDSIYDDYVSARWLRSEFASMRNQRAEGVREIAEIARGDEGCAALFREYGENIAAAVTPWIKSFAAEHMIIGGNVARAFDLFGPAMERKLSEGDAALPIAVVAETEDSAIRGAARLFDDTFWQRIRAELPTA